MVAVPARSKAYSKLKNLKDWKEYQVYFQRGIDRLKGGMERDRRAVEAIQRNDPEMNWSTGLGRIPWVEP